MRDNVGITAAPVVNGRSVGEGVDGDNDPRQRLLSSGPASLSNVELLAVLFEANQSSSSTVANARDVLRQIGGLIGLVNADDSLQFIPGVGQDHASTLLAAIELGRRLARTRVVESENLDNADVVADYLKLRYSTLDQEIMGALYLNVGHRLIAERELFRGTLYRTVVEPRVILKEALLKSAASMILFHTHPSGDPAPSIEDLDFTRRMCDAGKLLNIRLLDHLIIGAHGRWVSLSRRGGW